MIIITKLRIAKDCNAQRHFIGGIMYRRIFFIIGILFKLNYCYGLSVEHHIINNQPRISKTRARMISKLLIKHCKSMAVNPKVMQSLYRVESNYNVSAFNKYSKDYGIGQISIYNINAYNLDAMRLVFDLDYSIYWSVKVFSWFYHRYSLNHAIKRYNCGTRRSCINWKGPVNYLKKVEKYM